MLSQPQDLAKHLEMKTIQEKVKKHLRNYSNLMIDMANDDLALLPHISFEMISLPNGEIRMIGNDGSGPKVSPISKEEKTKIVNYHLDELERLSEGGKKIKEAQENEHNTINENTNDSSNRK